MSTSSNKIYSPQQIQAVLNSPNEFPPKVVSNMLFDGCFTIEQLEANGLSAQQTKLLKIALKSHDEQIAYQQCLSDTATYEDLKSFVVNYPDSSHFEEINKRFLAYETDRNLIGVLKSRLSDLDNYDDQVKEIEKFVQDNPFNLFIADLDRLKVELKQKHEAALAEAESKKAAAAAEAARRQAEAEAEAARRQAEAEAEAQKKREEELKRQNDESAWSRVLDILTGSTEADYKLSVLADYERKYTLHLDEIPQKRQEVLADREAMPRINSVFNDPVSDVIDYLHLIVKYPYKKDYICDWMLKDMHINPSRYDREEANWLLRGKFDDVDQIPPVFTVDQLLHAGVAPLDVWNHIQSHPTKAADRDPQESALTPETNFKSAENNTDIYFFGVPGSGKSTALAGLLKLDVCRLDDGRTIQLNLPAKGEHIGFTYASILQNYLTRDLFPQPTKTRFAMRQELPLGDGTGDGNGNPFADNHSVAGSNIVTPSTDTSSTDGQLGDKFIQIIDAQLIVSSPETGEEEHKLSIIEMPGERTLDFAAAKPDPSNWDAVDQLLGKGTRQLFMNNNRKVIFFVLDPSPFKSYMVKLNGIYTPMTQQQALNAVVDFLQDAPGLLEKVDAVHVILTKSDLLKNAGSRDCIMNDVISKGYQGLITNIDRLCSPSKGNVNAQCGHHPYLFTFSLGKVYPGEMVKYNPEDAIKILRVIAANTYSVRTTPTKWDSVVEWMNH